MSTIAHECGWSNSSLFWIVQSNGEMWFGQEKVRELLIALPWWRSPKWHQLGHRSYQAEKVSSLSTGALLASRFNIFNISIHLFSLDFLNKSITIMSVIIYKAMRESIRYLVLFWKTNIWFLSTMYLFPCQLKCYSSGLIASWLIETKEKSSIRPNGFST